MIDTSDGIQRRTTHETLKPAAVVRYHKNKAGVDRFDKLNAYDPFGRKTVKWWKKLFFYLIQMGVVNSYIAQKTVSAKKYTLLQYMTEL